MDLSATMQTLESLGTEQNRKVYPRHGVGPNLFGVSFADLGKLSKQIKKDTALALQLWQSGNHEARMLATMIASPAEIDRETLLAWVADLDNYILSDSFARLAAQTPWAEELMEEWIATDGEWTGRAGWRILAHLALEKPDLPDEYFERFLEIIEDGIHTRKNYVRDAMNAVLIGIGVRNPSLQAKALAAAARIGKVSVDHGKTNCVTPDASAYILKTWARKVEKPQKI